jgi:hypothetical protein
MNLDFLSAWLTWTGRSPVFFTFILTLFLPLLRIIGLSGLTTIAPGSSSPASSLGAVGPESEKSSSSDFDRDMQDPYKARSILPVGAQIGEWTVSKKVPSRKVLVRTPILASDDNSEECSPFYLNFVKQFRHLVLNMPESKYMLA